MNIAAVTTKEIPELARMWHAVFGDEEGDAMRLLTGFVPDGVFTMARENGVPAASVGLIDMAYHLTDSALPAAYVYAALTLPEYRGRGVMGALMRHALADCRKRGKAVCAVYPASDSLYEYYARFGFSEMFIAEEKCLSRAELAALSGGVAVAETLAPYEPMRKIPFSLQKSQGIFALALSEWVLFGGKVLAFPGGYACAAEKDGQVFVKELVCEDVSLAASALLREYPGAKGFTLRTPPGVFPLPDKVLRMGQARLTDVPAALAVLARANREMALTLRVEDPLIPENTGTYLLRDGLVRRLSDSATYEKKFELTDLCRLVLTGDGGGKPYFNMVFD